MAGAGRAGGPRRAAAERVTRETRVSVQIDLEGPPECRVATGIGMFDHLLEAFGRHARLALDIQAAGDLTVDAHHTVEDVGLVLGSALDRALGDRAGIARFGWALIPMDDALARVALDLSGRPYCRLRAAFDRERVGDFPTDLAREFFRAVATTGRMAWHGAILDGEDDHHRLEALFKAFGRALAAAASPDPREPGVPSTKGVL